MLCILIWIILLSPIIFVFLFYMRQKKPIKRLLSLILILYATAITAVMTLYPVENLFLRFSTPEEAFHYKHPLAKIINTYMSENQEVCVITFNMLSSDFSAYKSLNSFEQDAKGWKLSTPFSMFAKFPTFEPTNNADAIILFRKISTEWMMVEVDPINDKTTKVYDTERSSFQEWDVHGIIAFVKNIQPGYSITIDGVTYTLIEIDFTSRYFQSGILVILYLTIWIIVFAVFNKRITKPPMKKA